MARLTPGERTLLSAVRREKHIQGKGRHMHKRFRSWAQQRARQYWLPLRVTLTADTTLMDGHYLSACMQKAATNRKHDLQLWYGYCQRLLQIAGTLTPQQMAYAFYGLGKSRLLYEGVYRGLVPHVMEGLADYHSHALMCVCWALHRVQVKEPVLLEKIAEAALARATAMRPADYIKICNVLARMTTLSPSLCTKLSELMINRLDTIFAQTFRNVMCDVTICNLYDDNTKLYILERFSRIFIAARPQHYQQAFQAATAVRVLYPHVWYALPRQVRCFYIRLSMRRIPQILRRPSPLQWEVSNALAQLGMAHRNTFQWGCYWIDIGEADERRNCWFVDGPTSFYMSSNQYVEVVKLHHRILHDLGWNIRRVRWDDWIGLEGDTDKQLAFLSDMRQQPPLGAVLMDRDIVPAEQMRQLLATVKAHVVAVRQQAHADKQTIKFNNISD